MNHGPLQPKANVLPMSYADPFFKPLSFSLNTATVSPVTWLIAIEDLKVEKIWKFTPGNTEERNRKKF